jgi:hypothetical protein
VRKPTGYIVYEGPSLLDGAPIVAIATVGSGNRKTGGMVQTWILRADVSPIEASRTGADASICGACPHRGTPAPNATSGQAIGRTCYVVLAQAPLSVWRTYQRGGYPHATGHKATAALGAGRMVRVGSYGDGAAVPFYVWDSLTSEAAGHTAYTHQTGAAGADVRSSFYMASVDSEAAARAAWADGARTFRVVGSVADVVKGAEVLCPASDEAGKRTTCAECKLCGGAAVRAKSIAIVAHGNGARSLRA